MAENESEQGSVFKFEKTYLKDASFESPSTPLIFENTATQEVDVQFNISHTLIDEHFYEVVMTVKVNARQGQHTSFRVELQQGGVFQVAGVSKDDLSKLLETTCADILMAFAREAVCDLVVKGGFPQLLIDPVNFQTLYEEKQALLQQQGG